MKKINLILFSVLVTISFNCKAQQIPENQYASKIIGTWLLEDTNNKLKFTTNGICKVYVNNILNTTYEYSFATTNCENYLENNIVYLKWKDLDDLKVSCIEVSGMTTNTLSLMILDNAQILYYNRQ